MNDTTTADGLALYLSPDGNDNWSGRLPEPRLPQATTARLATLEWAREMVRRLARERRTHTAPSPSGCAVARYHLGQPVWFNGRDSGTDDLPRLSRRDGDLHRRAPRDRGGA